MCLRVSNWNPVLLNRSIRSDQCGGADRPFDGFALRVLPRPPRAVGLHDSKLRIGEQHERQVEFSDELVVRVDTVSADTYYN